MGILTYLDAILFAINIGLGIVILIMAWKTVRPAKGVHLAWWHILVITLVVWNWEIRFMLRTISDNNFFDIEWILPGNVPLWFSLWGTTLLFLANVAFWLILKVQRGRLHNQRMRA